MSEILFGQSYYLSFDPKLYAAMQPYPPLGTLYAAAYLRRRGYDVGLFDAMLAGSEDEWASVLAQNHPGFAVLYEDNFNYLSKMCLSRMRQAAFRMMELAKKRGCIVILCGADVTDHAGEYFAAGADYALIGEGEETLGELMDTLTGRSDRPLERILGLARPDDKAGERRNPPRPDIDNLDALPFPAWDLVDIPRYRAIWQQRHGYYSMNMVTTRGCPYGCNWCAKPIWGQRYNVRSPENVAAELGWLKATYRPDHIWFADDIFGLRPGWIEHFAEVVTGQGVATPFKCLMRVDLVKPPVAQALAAAGCQTVWIGAESGSQPILDAMGKGTTVAQIHAARRVLGQNGIKVGFFLQFGYPRETRADVECTLQMVRAALPDEIGVSVSYPLPGTRFYEQVKAQLGPKQNWVDSADLALLYEGPFPQPFYRTLYRAVHNEFRMRRAAADLRPMLRRPGRWRPRHVRLGAAVVWRWLNWQRARVGLDRAARRTTRVPLAADQGAGALSGVGPQLLETRQAFDSVAGDYDGPRGNNALVQRMREQMWRTLAAACPPGSRLLDLGCGTGLDALYLAQHGYAVVATDWSPEMAARTERRAAETSMSHQISVRTVGIQDLAALRGERFGGIYSDLGPLNCVPDLDEVAATCAGLLNPHGKMVVSVMGRCCPWENVYYGLRGDLGRARLRFARGAVPVNLNGHTVWTRYYTPREFYAAFAEQFVLTDYRTLGLFLPPPYLVRVYERWRVFARLLGWLDDRLGGLPLLRDSGDHFLMVLAKRD